MKRVLLLTTHLGANGTNVCHSLDQTNKIQWVKDYVIYDHPTKAFLLTEILHKYSSHSGIYLSEALFNHQIAHKCIYKVCNFIYLINEPKNLRVKDLQIAKYMTSYYILRLRRICEMAKETAGSLFITWGDLTSKKGQDFISSNLNVNFRLQETETSNKLLELPKSLLDKAEAAYERCIYRINNISQVLKC